MPGQRGSRGFARGQKRKVGWDRGPGGTAADTITASTSNFFGSVSNVLVDGLTLVRLRGRFSFILTAAAAAGDGYQGAMGIGVTTASATAAGIASVPTPITEQDWDGWLYWQAISCHAGDATAGSRNWDQANMNIEVDSKAMRKLTEDSSIFAVFEVIEIGTATASLFFDSRILVKLP